MRKIAWIGVLAAAAALVSCDPAAPPAADQTWIKLGNVADTMGGAAVFKQTDPDNGNVIYVAVGVNACSLSVVPKK